MEYTKLVRKISVWNTAGIRTKGRPKNIWRDEVKKFFKETKAERLE
jgi:hypothetical protein